MRKVIKVGCTVLSICACAVVMILGHGSQVEALTAFSENQAIEQKEVIVERHEMTVDYTDHIGDVSEDNYRGIVGPKGLVIVCRVDPFTRTMECCFRCYNAPDCKKLNLKSFAIH